MNSNEQNDKLKILVKFTTNFIKMLAEEECENIQIKFWLGLEEQTKNLQLQPKIICDTIFIEILNKSPKIIIRKNLFFCITQFSIKCSDFYFDLNFMDFCFNLMQNYEENAEVFNEYLQQMIITRYISQEINDQALLLKLRKFLLSLLDYDWELFHTSLKSIIETEENILISRFYSKSEMTDVLLLFFKIILKKNKEDLIFYYFEKLQLETKIMKLNIENNENLSKFYSSLSNIFYDLKLNNQDISTKIIIKLLQNIQDYLPIENSDIQLLTSIEKLLIVCLEIFNHNEKHTLFKYFKIFIYFYDRFEFKIFKNNFLTTIYQMTDDIYDSKTLKYFEEILRLSNKNNSIATILSELIIKTFHYDQKTRYSGDSILKLLLTNTNYQLTTNKCLSESYLYNYVISSLNFFNLANLEVINLLLRNFFEVEINKGNIIINFNQVNFLNTLKVLGDLNIENYDESFQHNLTKILLKILLFFFEPIYVKSEKVKINNTIFRDLFNNINKISSKSYLKTEIYPLIISFMQTIIYTHFDYFSDDLQVLDLFFDFLFSFKNCEAITNVTVKLIQALYNIKYEKKSNKLYALNKYVDLVVLMNSTKIFTTYFNFCLDIIKKDNQKEFTDLVLNSILKYSTQYEGALQSQLLEFLATKFESFFENPIETCNLETVFTLTSVFEILVKDQPERILNKIYENFYNKKILRFIDKIFKDLLPQKENVSRIICNEESLVNNNTHGFSTPNLFLNSNDKNKIYLGVLFNLSKIFAHFISNIIINNKDHFDVKTLSDPNNKIITSLIQTFDYITNGLLFSENEKTLPMCMFLNVFFSYFENLNFFYCTHSYFTAINEIEKQNLDLALLNDTNININKLKNQEFLDFLKIDSNAIFLIKNLVDNIFLYESNVLSLYNSRMNNNKAVVIDNLNDPSFLLNCSKDCMTSFKQNKNLSSFFIKDFLELIYSTKDCMNLINENIYLYLLSSNLLTKYYKNISDLLNIEIILLNFYNVLRINKREDLVRNFINNLLLFSKNSRSALLFSLRLLTNFKFFRNFLLVGNNLTSEFLNLTVFCLSQIIFYNSYKSESFNYILAIFDNLETILILNSSINFTNLSFYGKIVSELISLTKISADDKNPIEINKKFRENLLILIDDKINKYLDHVICQVFNYNVSIDISLFENFEIILNLKNQKLISEKIIKSYSSNYLLNCLFLLQETNLPRSMQQFQTHYCNLLKETSLENKFCLKIIETYIIYQILYRNNENIATDIVRNFLFNKDFYKLINWDQKLEFISMISLSKLRFEKYENISFSDNQVEVMKKIGALISLHILAKIPLGKTVLLSVGENYNIDETDKSADYIKLLRSRVANN